MRTVTYIVSGLMVMLLSVGTMPALADTGENPAGPSSFRALSQVESATVMKDDELASVEGQGELTIYDMNSGSTVDVTVGVMVEATVNVLIQFDDINVGVNLLGTQIFQ